MRLRLPVFLLVCAAFALAVPAARAASPAAPRVTDEEPLPGSLWIPGTGRALRVTYTTVGPSGAAGVSTGAIFLPAGDPPPGGWPVAAWAHGTVGVGDACAPSVNGPLLPERDRPYLAAWLAEGYAVLASDYTGLGTPGVMPYLNGPVTAHNVVDLVRAAADAYPRDVARRWVVLGQSQGGAAAVVTARYATEFGGPTLDYRGGVATGVPAYSELLVSLLGPGIPPFKLSEHFNVYILYILAGLRASYPKLDLDGYLTARGRRLVALAEETCPNDLGPKVARTVPGTLLRKPLARLPHSARLLREHMGLPERGFDRPLFVGQGLRDIDIPTPLTFGWAAKVWAARQPMTFRTYPADHSATLGLSLADSRPFVRRLFSETG